MCGLKPLPSAKSKFLDRFSEVAGEVFEVVGWTDRGRFPEGEDRAAGVSQDPVDGVVAGEALKCGALHGSEDDEAGLEFR
jgi:hypothetical protein